MVTIFCSITRIRAKDIEKIQFCGLWHIRFRAFGTDFYYYRADSDDTVHLVEVGYAHRIEASLLQAAYPPLLRLFVTGSAQQTVIVVYAAAQQLNISAQKSWDIWK